MAKCPECGHEVPAEVREFSGQGIEIPPISEAVRELVDGVIESNGYCG